MYRADDAVITRTWNWPLPRNGATTLTRCPPGRQPALHGGQRQRPVDRSGTAGAPGPGPHPPAQRVDLVLQVRIRRAGQQGHPLPVGRHPQLAQLLGEHAVHGRPDRGQPGAGRPGAFQPLQDRGRRPGLQCRPQPQPGQLETVDGRRGLQVLGAEPGLEGGEIVQPTTDVREPGRPIAAGQVESGRHHLGVQFGRDQRAPAALDWPGPFPAPSAAAALAAAAAAGRSPASSSASACSSRTALASSCWPASIRSPANTSASRGVPPGLLPGQRPGAGPDDGLGPGLHHPGRQHAALVAGQRIVAGRPPGRRPCRPRLPRHDVDLGLDQQRIRQVHLGPLGGENPFGAIRELPGLDQQAGVPQHPGPIERPDAGPHLGGHLLGNAPSRAARPAGRPTRSGSSRGCGWRPRPRHPSRRPGRAGRPPRSRPAPAPAGPRSGAAGRARATPGPDWRWAGRPPTARRSPASSWCSASGEPTGPGQQHAAGGLHHRQGGRAGRRCLVQQGRCLGGPAEFDLRVGHRDQDPGAQHGGLLGGQVLTTQVLQRAGTQPQAGAGAAEIHPAASLHPQIGSGPRALTDPNGGRIGHPITRRHSNSILAPASDNISGVRAGRG